MPKKVTIAEVGLRDGLQNECKTLTTETKLSILYKLIEAGFHEIELGSFVRPDVIPQMADTRDIFQAVNLENNGVSFRALVPNYRGLQNAIAAGCRNVSIGVSASKVHNLRNYNRTPEESVAAFEKIFQEAEANNVSVTGTVQMAFGSPWEGEIPLDAIVSIINIYRHFGLKSVGLGDTASLANPKKVYSVFAELNAIFPDIKFKAHFHNARGLGLTNVIAAMEAGVQHFDSSFAGLGGCPFVPKAAGNIATEDLVNMMNELEVETGIDIGHAIQIGHEVEDLVGHEGNSFILRAGTAKELYEKCRNND